MLSKRDRDRSTVWKFVITSHAWQMARDQIKGGKLTKPARHRVLYFSSYNLYWSYRARLKRYKVTDHHFIIGSLADE